MSATPVEPVGPGPQSRVVRNEERVLDAVVEILGTLGWAAVTHASASRAAGLSTRPVHDRFADRSAIAVATWRQRTGPALEAALAEVLASCGLLATDPLQEAPTTTPAGMLEQVSPVTDHWRSVTAMIEAGGARPLRTRSESRRTAGAHDVRPQRSAADQAAAALASQVDTLRDAVAATAAASARVDLEVLRASGPSEAWFTVALAAFARPEPLLRAAAELLIISQFDPALADQVRTQAAERMARWCAPTGENVNPRKAAQRAYVLSVSLGLLAAHHRVDSGSLQLDREESSLLAALSTESEPVNLPQSPASHLADRSPLATGDRALDALLEATLAEVGAHGFDGATVDSIAKAAGCSDGLVFSRYESKLALFLDATRRQQADSWRANDAFQQKIADLHGHAIADAVAIRELQRPEYHAQRALYLEQIRLSWHDASLRDAQGAEYDAFIAEARAIDPTGVPIDDPAALHVSIAVGFGLALLPLLLPNAWDLPYDVVTIPLAAHAPAR